MIKKEKQRGSKGENALFFYELLYLDLYKVPFLSETGYYGAVIAERLAHGSILFVICTGGAAFIIIGSRLG